MQTYELGMQAIGIVPSFGRSPDKVTYAYIGVETLKKENCRAGLAAFCDYNSYTGTVIDTIDNRRTDYPAKKIACRSGEQFQSYQFFKIVSP